MERKEDTVIEAGQATLELNDEEYFITLRVYTPVDDEGKVYPFRVEVEAYQIDEDDELMVEVEFTEGELGADLKPLHDVLTTPSEDDERVVSEKLAVATVKAASTVITLLKELEERPVVSPSPT